MPRHRWRVGHSSPEILVKFLPSFSLKKKSILAQEEILSFYHPDFRRFSFFYVLPFVLSNDQDLNDHDHHHHLDHDHAHDYDYDPQRILDCSVYLHNRFLIFCLLYSKHSISIFSPFHFSQVSLWCKRFLQLSSTIRWTDLLFFCIHFCQLLIVNIFCLFFVNCLFVKFVVDIFLQKLLSTA